MTTHHMTVRVANISDKQLKVPETPRISILDTRDLPFWIVGNLNGCQHEYIDYVGSFEYMLIASDSQSLFKCDVYFTKHNGVCIRHSNEVSDYSGFPCLSMMVGMGDEVTTQALKMVLDKLHPRK